MTARIRGLLVGCMLFAIYALTTSRSVGWEDSAFFQLCLATLGVPHGPGFPLYVLIGRVFVLPFGSAVAWAANLFSGLAMAAAGVVLLEIILLLGRSGPHDHGDRHHAWCVAGAMGVVLGWGTLEVIWHQAVRTEVYALVLLSVLLTVLFSLQSQRTRLQGAWNMRYAVAAACAWGWAMTIHPLIALAAATPWFALELWHLRTRPHPFAVALLLSMAPLTLYLYPIVRGSLDGAWAWGAFGDWSSIADYYLRRSAWSTVVTLDGGWGENLSGWVHGMPRFLPSALWIAVGIAAVWLRRNFALHASLLGTIVLVLWAAPFDPHNLDLIGYFLPFITLAAGLVGVFVIRSVRFLRMEMSGVRNHSRLALSTFMFILILGWPVAAVWAPHARPGRSAGAHGLVASIAQTASANGLLLATEDNLLGVLEYAQRVDGIRPDLVVVAPGALRYPFYRDRMRDLVPGGPSALWQSRRMWNIDEWEGEMRAWMNRLPDSVDVYMPLEGVPGVQVEQLVPAGLLYTRAGTQVAGIPWDQAVAFWRSAPERMATDLQGRDLMARWTFNFGAFAIARGHDRVGWEALLSAVRLTPDDPEIYFLLGRALGNAGRKDDARAMMAAAVDLAPFRARYRFGLEQYTTQWVVAP